MSGPVGIAGDQLRAIVERIEHVEEEIKELTEASKKLTCSGHAANSAC